MLIFSVSFRLSDVTEITCRLKRVVNAQTNPHAHCECALDQVWLQVCSGQAH